MNRERVSKLVRECWVLFFDCLGIDYRNEQTLENAIEKASEYIFRIIAEEGNGANLCSVCGNPSCSSRGKGFTEKCSVWQPQQPKLPEKLGKNLIIKADRWAWHLDIEKLLDKINSILDYLKARE